MAVAAAVVLVGGFLAPARTGAQPSGAGGAAPVADAKPVAFGLMGGFAQGPSRGVDPIGYHALASVEARTPLRPLRLRADGLFAHWGSGRMTAVTASAIVVPVPHWTVAPYLSLGGGGYHALGRDWVAGLTGGAGVRVPAGGRTLRLETRFHTFHDTEYRTALVLPGELAPRRYQTIWMPISVGIVF